MIELLKNCTHGSEIATFLVSNVREGKKIIKASSTPAGIKNVESEVEGWNWYQKIRYPDRETQLCKITRRKDNYIKIEIEYFEGTKPDVTKGLIKNADIIRTLIENYCCIWPYNQSDLAPLHGDLSIDNIICNSEGIHIIDWEHFYPRGAPWGFDALNALFEVLWFGMRKRKQPTQGEINIIVENINKLNINNRLDTELLERPLGFMQDFINFNSGLWAGQLAKMPVLNFTSAQVDIIDSLISRCLPRE